MKKLPILVFLLLLIFSFARPVYAAFNSFTWQVRDQNGNPLAEALVWVNLKLSTGEWQYVSWCSTDSSGQCSVTLSCAAPCELSGDVEYQGYTGSYSGAYNDGALIGVTINIPAPTPTPSPPPYPTPSLYPSPTPTPPPPPGYSCGPSAGVRVSRPDECELCNQTGLFCPSCATSFTVHDTVSYYWHEGTPEEPHCVERTWEGDVIINASETTIPFVGLKGGEDEVLYLADYFEGTSEYYKDYPKYWLQWVNHAGVWRKLTPMEYQNIFKKEMVRRESTKQPGEEGAIHDYRLNYRGRICWDFPFLAEVFLALLQRYASEIPSWLRPAIDFIADKAHYCVFEGSFPGVTLTKAAIDFFNGVSPIDIIYFHTTNADDYLSSLTGHFPPTPDEENYVEKWNAWKESGERKWFKLWHVAPMVSREDTPGYIDPDLGYRPLDTPKYIPPQLEKVPHVARLYETSQEIKNMLMPSVGTGGLVQKKTKPIIASADEERVMGGKTLLAQSDSPCGDVTQKITEPIIASAEEKILGEKVLLAQDPGCIPCGCKVTYPTPDCGCLTTNSCMAEDSKIGQCGYHMYGGCICSYYDCRPADRGCAPGQQCCGIPFCPGFGPGPGPTPGVCELAGPISMPNCDLTAITDPNDNDDICGPEINIGLRAVDRFINYNYTPCEYGWICPGESSSVLAAQYLVQSGKPCTYCENCGGSGTHQCHGTIQNGVCKYDPAVPPNCTPCKFCGNGNCDVCEGADWCPEDCGGDGDGDECYWGLLNPECMNITVESVSRKFAISLLHPYLTEIWEQTGMADTNGLFNFFRPAAIPEFEEVDAASEIKYSYHGGVTPETGKFYFNYLGGVQLAKDWLIRALTPYVE